MILGLEGNPVCQDCGYNLVHLGHGEYLCPKCGYEISYGEEGFTKWGDYDFEGMAEEGIEYDDLYERPKCCSDCGKSDTEFPDCIWDCNKREHDFVPKEKF